MTNKTKIKLISAAVAGAAFAILGLDNTLTLADYIVRSDKIKKPVSLVFISDIHSQSYKDGGKKLLDMICSSNPDFLLIGGDVFDKYSKDKEIEAAKKLMKKIAERFDNCYCVLGNHEIDNKAGIDYKTFLSEINIGIFNGESYELTAKNGQKILLGGIDYVKYPNDVAENFIKAKKELIERAEQTGLFSVLLRHVPMKTDGDEKIDLILSGHNHGGLWRFPNTNVGVAGGGKKFFPRYAHGKYRNGSSTMIVGSGVTTKTYLLPRLYNVPEVVKVTLLPKTNMSR